MKKNKITLDFRKKSFISSIQEYLFNLKNLIKLQNISIILIMFFVLNLNSQITYPVPNYYGYCWGPSGDLGSSSSHISPPSISNVVSSTSTLSNTSSSFTYNSIYITKKSSTPFNYFMYAYNTIPDRVYTPSNCLDNSALYSYVSDESKIDNTILNNNYGFSNHANLGFGSFTNAGVTRVDNWQIKSDSAFFDKAKQNIITFYHNYLAKNVNGFRIKRNSEFSFNIYNYDFGQLYYNNVVSSSLYYRMRYAGLKHNSTIKFIVTDPTNWTTYQANDYDYINSTAVNPVYKTTRFAELYGNNTSGGTFQPSFFINSATDTNIWNTRISNVELYHRQYGSSGTFQYNFIGKSGMAWSSMTASTINGMVRYWYTLDDDPATTTGPKIGFVDVMFNSGICTPPTIGTTSNPITLCVGESFDLRAAIINNNGGSFINLPYPELQDNITVSGTGVTGTTFTNTTPGTYTVNVKITYDNAEENFSIKIKVLNNPLAQNSTNFKYGDGTIGGSTATQLEICQGDKSLNTTTIANTFFNNTSNTFYGVTAPTDFSWGLKQGSTIGAYVATGTSKNNTMNYSTLAAGDYYMEMYHGFAPSTSNICDSKQYYFKVVVKPLPSAIVVTKDTFNICNNKQSVNLTANTVSPTGVTWTGSGISNNVFTGSSVSPNTYLITGTLTGTNGCQRLDTVIIINKEGVSLSSISTTPSICKNTNTINLNDLIIVADKGGKHSNPLYASSITNDSIFTPSIVDFHNIRYIKIATNGCSDTITYNVKVNALPTAPSFQKNNDSVCIVTGGPTSNITLTNFYNVVSASGTTGTWDGTNQSNGTVDINSLAVGSYQFKYIQSTTNSCLDTTIFTLKANNGSASLIQFTKNFDTVCHSSGNINLELYNKVVKGGTWSYTPNSIQSNVLLSTFLPINSIENITYTADTLGCSMQKTLSLYRFKPSASAGADKNVCSNGSAVLLQGNPLGGSWKLDSAGSPVQVFDPKTFSVTQSNEAVAYNLYYTVTNSGCATTDTAIYTIVLKPKIQYVKKDDSICSSANTLNLTSNYGVNPNTGIWEGSNLNNADFSITSSGPGMKNFKYIVQSQYGCYDTTTFTLRVDQKDSTGLFEPTDFKVCEASAPINLNTFKLVPSTGLYSSLGGNNNIIDSLFYPTTSGVGTFTINYATSNKSCTYNLSKKIFVVAKPTMPDYLGKTMACSNENLQFSVKNPDQTYSYFWDNNSSASNSYSTIAGNKTIKLYSKNFLGCKSVDNNIAVTLNDPSGSLNADKLSILDNEDVVFNINTPININSVNWNFGDGSDIMTNSSTNITHRYYNPSTSVDVEFPANIELVSSSNCKLVLNNVKIKVLKRTTNGIIDNQNKQISIYPNPFISDFNIFNSTNKKLDFQLFDLTGKLIKDGQIDPGTSQYNLSNISKGIYFIKIQDEVYKLIKD